MAWWCSDSGGSSLSNCLCFLIVAGQGAKTRCQCHAHWPHLVLGCPRRSGLPFVTLCGSLISTLITRLRPVTHYLHFLSCGLVLVSNFVPRILLEECRQDPPHLIAVGSSWVDDSGDTGDHGTVEHLELTSNGIQLEIRYFLLELLTDLEIELCSFEARGSGSSISIGGELAEKPWSLR